ncbi:TRAP-type mannitol/chloroaromatic compound transport system, substrate-binding protein [Cohaesibacter sp. ES.047]|uniref:TRAP transporter substrate-binding protein n=1 Tax=Cohaesibacter sp. ES.047 TaxID=1798205 RepID=UPI000BB7D783|nr:TRAP transporter substrate-binding protein [Cohaesibacter sp. ES.047]SNY90331.1 TRAP-type mannitol/chloroaromatic compound transport system, substrate-binding protein [Cohaesibacter sp. ES.047]
MRKSGSIDRRSVLTGLAAGGAAGLASPTIVRAQENITWKMAMSWPKQVPGVGVNGVRFAEKVTKMTDGRLTIKVYGAGELVPPLEVFDAVSSGAAECGHATSYYWQGKDPAFHFFTGVPFGLTQVEHAAWLYFGGAQELWDKAYAPFGVTPFYAGASGTQAAGWFAKEIKTLEDLKGLKMRIAGLGGEVLRRLGASVVMLPPTDIFSALQSGTIDAAEWVGPWNDMAFGLYKVVGNYYMPAFHELGAGLEVIVNTEKLKALPEDIQLIVKEAARATSMETMADFAYNNAASFGPLKAKEGVTVRALPDDIVMALAKESDVVVKEIADSSPLAGEIYKSFVDFRALCNDYHMKAEWEALRTRKMALEQV